VSKLIDKLSRLQLRSEQLRIALDSLPASSTEARTISAQLEAMEAEMAGLTAHHVHFQSLDHRSSKKHLH
jgi:hypothetical protein